MKYSAKLTALLLALLMITLALISCGSGKQAATTAPGSKNAPSGKTGTASWSFDKNTGTLKINGSGRMDDYDHAYGGNMAPWDEHKPDVKTIEIANGITYIGKSSFAECTSLKSVKLPDSVKEIGNWAFYGCSELESVTMPENLEIIGEACFLFCPQLGEIDLPKSVKTIGGEAFSWCMTLTAINVDPANNTFSSVDGILFSKDMTEILCFPIGKDDVEYTIPDSVKRIGDSAFETCNRLASITIPEGVTAIGDSAFTNCSAIETVIIPYGVTEIGDYVFANCQALKAVLLPATITSIGTGAFSSCPSLENLTVDPVNEYFSTADGILYNKDKTELRKCPASFSGSSFTVPKGTKVICETAFDSCYALENVTIPASVEKIGSYAFAYCYALKTVEYKGTVEQWRRITIETANENFTGASITASDGTITIDEPAADQ